MPGSGSGSGSGLGRKNGIPKDQHASSRACAPLWAPKASTLCISIGAPKPASLNNVQLDVKRKGRSWSGLSSNQKTIQLSSSPDASKSAWSTTSVPWSRRYWTIFCWLAADGNVFDGLQASQRVADRTVRIENGLLPIWAFQSLGRSVVNV